MRRAITAGLLIVCLGVFLCPAVGKVTFSPPPQKQSCCAETGTCKKAAEVPAKPGGCAKEKSQPSQCCPSPCSALVLFCSSSGGHSSFNCAEWPESFKTPPVLLVVKALLSTVLVCSSRFAISTCHLEIWSGLLAKISLKNPVTPGALVDWRRKPLESRASIRLLMSCGCGC